MTATPPKFRYPPDIELESSPLVEAWLELRWQLDPSVVGGALRDLGFAFALGPFYSSVSDRFPFREDLDASRAPEEALPHVARHRFRPGPEGWPLIQFGPGVATVNFVPPYNWVEFKEQALYLRGRLTEAYETELSTQMAALRYKNGISFPHNSESILRFFKDMLNVRIELPEHIPGAVGSTGLARSTRISVAFDLVEPPGRGSIQAGTGLRKSVDDDTGQEQDEDVVLWELEVVSRDEDAPALDSEDEMGEWLTAAHSVIHEWFFCMIDGTLYQKYRGEGD